jgi:hypothetical protein
VRSPAHDREIALGLELAGVRFFWALRLTSGGMIPDGFHDRVAGRSVVRVLSRTAVGS